MNDDVANSSVERNAIGDVRESANGIRLELKFCNHLPALVYGVVQDWGADTAAGRVAHA